MDTQKLRQDAEFIEQILEHLYTKNNNTGDIDVAINMLEDWLNELKEEN